MSSAGVDVTAFHAPQSLDNICTRMQPCSGKPTVSFVVTDPAAEERILADVARMARSVNVMLIDSHRDPEFYHVHLSRIPPNRLKTLAKVWYITVDPGIEEMPEPAQLTLRIFLRLFSKRFFAPLRSPYGFQCPMGATVYVAARDVRGNAELEANFVQCLDILHRPSDENVQLRMRSDQGRNTVGNHITGLTGLGLLPGHGPEPPQSRLRSRLNPIVRLVFGGPLGRLLSFAMNSLLPLAWLCFFAYGLYAITRVVVSYIFYVTYSIVSLVFSVTYSLLFETTLA